MSKQRVYCKIKEFQPRSELILVKPTDLQTEEKTESGLIIAINAHNSVVDRPSMGKVLAVGEKVDDVAVDSIVFWPSTDGINFEFDDGEVLLLKQTSIIGSKR